jgi:hypothetical protein
MFFRALATNIRRFQKLKAESITRSAQSIRSFSEESDWTLGA